MSLPPVKRVDPVLTAINAIRFAVAARFESWCLKWLHSELDCFISGAEKAEVECGLWLGDNDLTTSGYSEQLFETVYHNRHAECMVALDCKTISPVLSQSWKGGLYHFEIARTEAEQACSAFIVHNPAAPDHVALIPSAYLERARPGVPQQRFFGRDIPLTGSPIEPFSLEWSPFVMPLRVLPKALKQLRDFARDRTSLWQNPNNHIRFKDLNPPAAQKLKLLLPSTQNRTDYYDIRHLYEVIDRYSNRFRVERPSIQPSVADFLLRDKITQLFATVEMKRESMLIEGDKLSIPLSDWGVGSLCLPWNNFDFLMCVHANRRKAYVFSRDELPDDWAALLGKRVDSPDSWLTIQISSPDRLENHALKWDDDQQLAKGVESVFLAYLEKGQFRAQKPHTLSKTSAQVACVAVAQEIEDNTDTELNDAAAIPPWRGSRGRWSRKQFEASCQELLEKQLRVSNHEGRLIYLGLHPCGTFAFVPYVLQDLSFHDLELSTPLVYVNMATIEVDDQLVPHDGKRTRALMHATHGSHESIYVVAPNVKGMADPCLKVYVLPSWLLKTPQRVAWHQILLDSPGKLNSKRVFLAGGENFETYACTKSQVIERIISLSREHADRLWSNKQVAVEHFFKLFTGKSFLGIRVPRHHEDEGSDED